MFLIISLLVISIGFICSADCSQDSTQYSKRIQIFLNEIDIIDSLGYPVYYEECNLESIGKDIYGREQFLSAKSAVYFKAIINDAILDGIEINFISGFRSFNSQANIIRKKIDRGYSTTYILNENMIPGYSQHHTGCAIDIAPSKGSHLSQDFENSEIFKWLEKNAHKYHFFLTYPRNNKHGIKYEPWHWMYINNQ